MEKCDSSLLIWACFAFNQISVLCINSLSKGLASFTPCSPRRFTSTILYHGSSCMWEQLLGTRIRISSILHSLSSPPSSLSCQLWIALPVTSPGLHKPDGRWCLPHYGLSARQRVTQTFSVNKFSPGLLIIEAENGKQSLLPWPTFNIVIQWRQIPQKLMHVPPSAFIQPNKRLEKWG